VGVWKVVDVCTFPVPTRPAQNYDSTRGYFQPETGVTAPAQTSGPWCWDLSFDTMGNLATPSTPMANPPDRVVAETPLAISRVTFNADGTYLYALTAYSKSYFHVAKSCFGVNGTIVDGGITGQYFSCTTLASKIASSGIGANPSYKNPDPSQPAFGCSDAGDGCDCYFYYIETDAYGSAVGDSGRWAQDGNTLHNYSIEGQGNLNDANPSRRTVRDATFCQTADTMVLQGANGGPLALKAGTRTLFLQRLVVPDGGADAAAGATGAGGSGGGGAGGAAGEDGAAGAGGAAGADAAAESPGADSSGDGPDAD
jgi:hypothetical protein